MVWNNKITKNELIIMSCLWNHSPLLCEELLQDKNLNGWNNKSTYNILKNLLDKNMIYVAGSRGGRGKQKVLNLYAPTITNTEYLASLVTTNITYKESFLPIIFQGLINSKLKKSTIDELYEIIEQAKSETE